MRVHIIGPGIVGQATGSLFTRFGHDVVYTDKGENHRAVESDWRIVCVPEAAVEDVIVDLHAGEDWVQKIAIRSTTPPGLVQQLANRFPTSALCHLPEHLREATAEADAVEGGWVLLGIPRNRVAPGHYDLLLTALGEMGKAVVVATSTETEMAKLVANAHLATLISFWNETRLLCEELSINSHKLARLVLNDDRVSPYGALRHGQPFGGLCLPKDLKQLLNFGDSAGVPNRLLAAVEYVNENGEYWQ